MTESKIKKPLQVYSKELDTYTDSYGTITLPMTGNQRPFLLYIYGGWMYSLLNTDSARLFTASGGYIIPASGSVHATGTIYYLE